MTRHSRESEKRQFGEADPAFLLTSTKRDPRFRGGDVELI
jgi:hypothetical protein